MADTAIHYSDTAVALLKADIGFFGTQIPADLEALLACSSTAAVVHNM